MTPGVSVPRFWREIPQRYNLIGNKCSKCGWINFPPRSICPECKDRELGLVKLKGGGEVVTYTVIRAAPPGFEELVPYVIAIVQLEEGPRITAQVVDCSPEDISIGAKVRSCFRKIAEDGRAGAISYGYKFKLVE